MSNTGSYGRSNSFLKSQIQLHMPPPAEQEADMESRFGSMDGPTKEYRRTRDFEVAQDMVVLLVGAEKYAAVKFAGACPAKLLPIRFCGILRRDGGDSGLVNVQRTDTYAMVNELVNVDKQEDAVHKRIDETQTVRSGDEIYATLPYKVDDAMGYGARPLLHIGVTPYDTRDKEHLLWVLHTHLRDIVVETASDPTSSGDEGGPKITYNFAGMEFISDREYRTNANMPDRTMRTAASALLAKCSTKEGNSSFLSVNPQMFTLLWKGTLSLAAEYKQDYNQRSPPGFNCVLVESDGSHKEYEKVWNMFPQCQQLNYATVQFVDEPLYKELVIREAYDKVAYGTSAAYLLLRLRQSTHAYVGTAMTTAEPSASFTCLLQKDA